MGRPITFLVAALAVASGVMFLTPALHEPMHEKLVSQHLPPNFELLKSLLPPSVGDMLTLKLAAEIVGGLLVACGILVLLGPFPLNSLANLTMIGCLIFSAVVEVKRKKLISSQIYFITLLVIELITSILAQREKKQVAQGTAETAKAKKAK